MDDECIDHGDDMVVALFVFLSVERPILRETSTEMDRKLRAFNFIFLKNRQKFSMVCSLIDYRTDLVPVPREMVKFKPGLSQILSKVFLSNPGLALVGLSGTGPLSLKLTSDEDRVSGRLSTSVTRIILRIIRPLMWILNGQ